MLRLVQKGVGSQRPVVILFLVGPHMDKKLRAALGPRPCIVADDTAGGTTSFTMLLHQAAGLAGEEDQFEAVVLCGYSLGVGHVRAFLKGLAMPLGVVAIDGTHAGAKRGALMLGSLAAAKRPRSWQWQTAVVFLSPSGLRVVSAMKRSSSKAPSTPDS